MVCQKVHKQSRIKVMVKIQSLIHLYIFSQKNEDVGNAEMLVSTPAQIIFSFGCCLETNTTSVKQM